MYDILVILIPFFIAACIVVAIRIVVEARLRRRLAETHASDALLQSMLAADEENRRQSSLKWGLVILLAGAGCILVDLLGLSINDPSTFGVLLVSMGIGLITYHALARPKAGR
jgi:glycerol uptake facilitator-like aquaporin